MKYLDSGAIADHWGDGYFLALKFNVPEDATSVKVGLSPSVSSGLVEIIDDPDKNGVFKVTDKSSQVFRIRTAYNGEVMNKDYRLSGLTLEPAEEVDDDLEENQG